MITSAGLKSSPMEESAADMAKTPPYSWQGG